MTVKTQEELKKMSARELVEYYRALSWLEHEVKTRKGEDQANFILLHGLSSDAQCARHPELKARRAHLRRTLAAVCAA